MGKMFRCVGNSVTQRKKIYNTLSITYYMLGVTQRDPRFVIAKFEYFLGHARLITIATGVPQGRPISSALITWVLLCTNG